ncbi:MAG: hypothetical protein ACOCV9_03480, partial [Marinilabiliaceae bacterium]
EELFGKKDHPFEVPENYFEDFERRMMEKVEGQPAEEKGKVVSLFSAVKPWIAMAAGFLLIAVIYYQAPRFFDQHSNEEETVVVEESAEDAFINSLAYIVDEGEINELILSGDSTLVLPPDTFYFGEITEDELASLSYFDYN